MDAGANATTEDWRVLVAFGLDGQYNYGLRKFVWYGIWIHVLKDFTFIKWCYLLDQYPLWAVNSEPTLENEPNSTFDNSVGNSNTATYHQPVSVKTPVRSEYPSASNNSPSTSSTSSDFSIDMTADIPITPVRERFNLEVPSAPSQLSIRSMARIPETPSTPVRAALTKAIQIISKIKEENIDDGNNADGTYDDASNATSGPPRVGTHKVPDFAIVHLKHTVDENMISPFVRIKSRVVPILVEIKRYICRGNDHNHTESIVNRYDGHKLAIKALRTQSKYLFSSGTQSAVVAIAASGNYWYWVQFIKENGKIATKPADGDTSEDPSEYSDHGLSIMKNWSGEFEIGTERSAQMFKNIGDWVRKITEDPHNTRLDIIYAN